MVRPRLLLDMADLVLGWVTEIPAAILVVAEIIILLMGVVARFVFDRPLVWSDEIASLLFLWLAMLGAAIALRRGVHMRLTTVVSRMSPRWRARADALAVGIPLIFLALLIGPSLDYVDDQSFIQTPALSWPGSIRASAMVAGLVLMLAVALLRLFRLGWRDVAAGRQRALAVIAAGDLGWRRPVLQAVSATGTWCHLLRGAAGLRRF